MASVLIAQSRAHPRRARFTTNVDDNRLKHSKEREGGVLMEPVFDTLMCV